MSVDKFSKHQKSRRARYIMSDPNGEVLIATNDEKEYMEFRQKFLSNPDTDKMAISKARRIKRDKVDV